MENFEKMINDVIEDLDWRMILGFYQKLDLTWYGKDLLKKNSLQKRNPTIEELQNELRSVCRFAIQKGVEEYVYDNWTIIWLDPNNCEEDEFFDDDFGCQLEVLFTPTRSLAFENSVEFCEEQEQITHTEMEMVLLEDMLEKALKKEDYESASKYRDKILELKKELVVPVKINNKRKGK